MPPVFIFSGLGADHRVFEEINFGAFHPVFIPWEPLSPNESLASYASKMSVDFPQNVSFILIGISFGGILAQEVGKLFPKAKILLIASVRNKYQLPYYMRISGKLHLEKIIPFGAILTQKKMNERFFGVTTGKEKEKLGEILLETDPGFSRWAVGQIMRWDKTTDSDNSIIHIHGSADRIFPIHKTKPDIIVPAGSHFMTVSRADELSPLICMALEKLSDENVF